MEAVTRIKPWEVDQRLGELGLSTEGLHEVAKAGFRGRAGCSPLHPPTFPGTSAWAACVHGLRSRYIPLGWRFADPGNFSITINDKKRIFIVCATGDEVSGTLASKVPTTKSPKGLKTEIAVRRQGDFWPDAITKEEMIAGDVDGYHAFWFLLNICDRRIYSELSSPSVMERGKIISWRERNVLPMIDLDGTPLERHLRDDKDGFTSDFDVPVTRIA